MNRRHLPLAIFLVVLAATWNLALYTVPQWKQAMVVQLGEPVRIVQEPGLYWKIPFVQNVLYFDLRLMDYDASPRDVLTKDKQQLVVDNFARWRIRDPLQFYRTVRDEAGAASRLDDIIYSDVRENLGRHTLAEIIKTDRPQIMAEVTQACDKKTRDYGIEIADVRIKRADLPVKTEMNVFSRMRTERERLAKKFRAEGDEEARKVRSEADKQVSILMAEARKSSEIRRGEGDAQAVKIFADASARDPDFYLFVRTLEAYRNAIQPGTSLVLSPDSEFLHLFQGDRRPARP
ncbi:MAG TPA: protease modulator HflC [Candidatus Binatia bacterium]|jgi:membrane protease subunit HflC